MAWLLVALLVATSGTESSSGCWGVPDADADGLSDSCELELARRFAPTLVVSSGACNWDGTAGRLRGGYLFGVAPTPEGIRIAYLPAYEMDCGWRGPKCWLRWRGGCDPHEGDSEFLAVDIAGGEEEWKIERVFMSAHCFRRSNDCRWRAPEELQRFGSRFLVWVAEGKNANYPSKEACDAGHWRYDTCDRNQTVVRFPIESGAQNIGSAARPFPAHSDNPACVTRDELGLGPGDGQECIWTDRRFRGWVGAAARGATGYWRYLTEVVGWLDPNDALETR